MVNNFTNNMIYFSESIISRDDIGVIGNGLEQ